MRVRVIAVGTRMPAWVRSACDDYLTRLAPQLRVSLVEIEAARARRRHAPARAIAAEASACSPRCAPASTSWPSMSAARS